MDRDMMVWPGFFGRDYEFLVFSVKKTFSPFGAVFIYASRHKNGEFEMLYINQTDRMDMVATNPIADFIIKEYQPTTLHVWKCPSVDDRKDVMLDLIMKHNPPGNRSD